MLRTIKDHLKKTRLYPVWLRMRGARKQPFGYDYIFGDITNACNLRCPFCCNDWSDPFAAKPAFVTKDHFQKILTLIPLAANGDYHLSCAYEPLLHPDFPGLVSMIPPELRNKVLFTTNLTRPVSDAALELLSRSGLRHINISIESFRPDVYETCRKNGRYSRFMDNLTRLAACFSANPQAPPIHYITMASRLNAPEIPAIVERCSAEFHASTHQIRNFFIVPDNTAWVAENMLSDAEWDDMERALSKIPCACSLYNPVRESRTASGPPVKLKKLWVQSDGVVRIEYGKTVKRISLDDVGDPYGFFKKELKKLK